MRFSRLVLHLILTSCFTLFAATLAHGQITNVTNTTSTPIPGVGHDYIRMMNETVNPANGSVSLRIGVPSPPGRRLSVPFSFTYDSNGVHMLTADSASINWSSDSAAIAPNPYIFGGGWSYSLPKLTSQAVQLTDTITGQTYVCYYRAGYVFRDSWGARYSIAVLHALKNTATTCATQFGIDEATSAQEGPYQATLTANGLVVAGPDGTTYGFSDSNLNPVGGIEDRNGNLRTGCCIDDSGRTVVSLGYSTTTPQVPTTVTVSGLPNPYAITTGTASSNFTVGSTYDCVNCDLTSSSDSST